ncbi:hypothetical protein HN51_058578 [Arachis hypogaea]|uniref:Uncharacterized protein n=1 Tax=Arachis hypogaea TaxID=3818 RepID=A0A444X1Y2_ARAHY|nr:uncharacterized protein LOC107622875 [Arachis ipaensis]XP_020969947.1 uncharacterized protein LOC107622875 [Arachis ipaensis]XP_025682511.1 uncharacterized protein LOC112783684 [Arachis hypogaea]XP_025682512.1 uncharacterized protein LOC112783684 [Arachis hypogaea]QHN81878.1 uncharacterized protein DS421_20g690800 [Arachis hypogaea]QHN81879.1 uncharacterized protein DS421_20g690800 [Arachis hypogaea]RYQ83591.1 hypothetical protein Ahy_B10g102337 isoform A [Arachis hypogaea]RYQ83592.1 hypo
MGKSFQSFSPLRIVSSVKSQRPRLTQPPKPSPSQSPTKEHQRTPLAAVVADCARRWFHETLQEAKAGDAAMQVLVGQMYYSGYGVPRNPKKGYDWISRVSRIRSSVWKVNKKRPGYRASDSDSCEPEVKTKSCR